MFSKNNGLIHVRLVCYTKAADFGIILPFFSTSSILVLFTHPPPCLPHVPCVVWTSLGCDCCSLSHIHLISLSLMVQREGAKEPLILGRHNVQGERNRGAYGMGGLPSLLRHIKGFLSRCLQTRWLPGQLSQLPQ